MSDERSVFLHPPWMVGIMLILGVLSLVVGLTIDPFWLVMGAPAILTLVVYIGVRITLWWRVGQHPSGVGQGDDRGGGSMPALERSTADEVARDDPHRP